MYAMLLIVFLEKRNEHCNVLSPLILYYVYKCRCMDVRFYMGKEDHRSSLQPSQQTYLVQHLFG